MAGFRSVGEWVDAAEGGQNHITVLNKAGVTGSQGGWHDLSGGAGYPPPNYFASSPLTAATIAAQRLNIPSVSPKAQYLHNLRIMQQAGTATSTANQNASFYLMDYLLYYPFIDLTSTALQEMDNLVTLPRYTSGEGVRLMMVMQASSGNYSTATMTINYTNSQGVAKTANLQLPFASYGAPVIVGPTKEVNMSALHPFVPLENGDSGIRSVESVQLSADWGGLCALVLVKPIFSGYMPQECRRTTTGNLDSFGSPVEYQNLIHKVAPVPIEDGAYLSFAMFGPVAANPFSGTRTIAIIETVWN